MPKTGNKRQIAHNHPAPPALTAWPTAPRHFTAAERASWKRVGAAAMSLGSVARPDLLLAEALAQVDARVRLALLEPDVVGSALVSLVRLEADLLTRMGLTPLSRKSVGPLAKPAPRKSPLTEF